MQRIAKFLIEGKSVVLVGPSDSGKTYFVKNNLIPELESKGFKVFYFEDGDSIKNVSADIVIFDEAELVIDQEHIEKKEGKLYNSEYVEKIKKWHNWYSRFSQPALYVVSRKKEDIPYLMENLEKLEWNGKEVKVIEFKR